MITNPRFPLLFRRGLLLMGLILGLGTGQACAQSAGLDETVGPDGVMQSLPLTATQRNAIYNAVMQQGAHASSERMVAKIGAPVSPSVTLYDLPDQAALGAGGDSALKYAMVGSQVVVVDPFSMRVVDVIGQSAEP